MSYLGVTREHWMFVNNIGTVYGVPLALASTIGRASEKIQGASADMTVTTERAAFTLVYVDATQGWLLTNK